jgi:hypothetical protein
MKLRREVGFWPALLSLRLGQILLGWEFLPAAVLGIGGGIVLLSFTTLSERAAIVGDYLVLLGPFVGVVLAGLAMVIALLSDRYLLLLKEAPNGVIGFLRPFMLAVGFQIAALLVAVAYRAAASELPKRGEEIAFCAVSFLFVLGALEVVAVTRNLLAHALLRADQAEVEHLEEQGVRAMRDRRPGSR